MITARHYDPDTTTPDVLLTALSQQQSILSVSGVNWINIEMQGDDSAQVNALMDLFDLDEQFRIHVKEMVLPPGHDRVSLPTFDTVKTYALFRLNMLSISKTLLNGTPFTEDDIDQEQVSLIGLNNTLLSFQQGNIDSDVFGPVRRAIEKNKYQIREHRVNHLFYLILETILDEYFKIVAAIREQFDDLEEQQQQRYADEQELMREIIRLKKIIRFLRRETIHLKRAFDDIRKNEHAFSIDAATGIYYDTIRNHINELLSYYDYGSDNLTDLINVSISLSGAKMQRVMKTLTLVSSIFIPLTFIAGVYGMNFENMPELSWPYGYFMVLGVMATISAVTLLLFRKWF